jgi:NodT family efflux transporter outer membrane factor (OMF) lipoprotein
LFGDPALNALETNIDVSNLTIAQAEARYRGARAAARLAGADRFPTITTSPSVVRSNIPPPAVTTYEIPVDFSWELDVFGRIRRTIEASTAAAEASAADLESVRLAMHAELATDYFTLRGLDAQRELLDTTVSGYETALRLTSNRYDQGLVSGVDVAQAKTQLESTRAESTDLRLAREQSEHAIAVLLGEPPANFSLAPGAAPDAPPDVPAGLPSDLLERRPDIASAERQAAAANAGIGVAKAAYFPTFTLSASGGYRSATIADLFSLPARFFSLGASAFETIFSGGRRHAAEDQAVASYDALVAGYRLNVLTAFQEVEDNLAALRDLEEESQQQSDAVASAEHLLALSRNRYQGGVTSYLEVVIAQVSALANERTAVDLSTRRMVATVNLVKALGGGWDGSLKP